MATSPKHFTVVRHPSFLSQATALRDAGFAVHWLKEKTKEPAAGRGWPELPVATVDQLKSTYRDGLNVGLRTGEPSHVAGMYAHVFDVDIRFPDLADEAWEEFDRMFPGIRDTLPCVVSGSGGASRHLHFLTDKPFYGRKLAVSETKHRTANGGWTYDWEIDLFGTGRQVALPPSIHPNTGIAYRWEHEYDLDGLEFGGGPVIDAEAIEELGVASTGAFDFEACPPKTFKPGQMENELDALSLAILDDRAKWVMIGQALHHQFGGAQEGFDLWMRYSAKSESHLKDSSLRAELSRYRGFGRNRRQPVTMATIRRWYLEERDAANLALAIAELDDLDDVSMPVEATPTSNTEGGEFDELLTAEPVAITGASDDAVFDIGLTDPALDWKSLLAVSEKGSIESNLHNLHLILDNDKRTAGVIAFNEFSQENVQRGVPGIRSPNRKNQAKPFVQLGGSIWTLRDRANGDFWSEAKDDSLRRLIEAPKTQGGYGIRVSDRDLRSAINVVAQKNCFHPVREYLSAQAWRTARRGSSDCSSTTWAHPTMPMAVTPPG
ncbi:bifunctional DNA primase/polymerase [Sphingomonas faeni]|uniref:bifunctional DNA primase/polymerase n=1 Tax=Sphingomonas faeni TaxID=185950 RepID=UPI0027D8C6F7|nr:bifunctional DNA primase/polymerase [Sphingomonas faeni]